jgi:microsomal dipeptidase-like Zn-dependent dipeptidase
MEEASRPPTITDALLKKGYTGKDITTILGGNILPVMEAGEREAVRRRKQVPY